MSPPSENAIASASPPGGGFTSSEHLSQVSLARSCQKRSRGHVFPAIVGAPMERSLLRLLLANPPPLSLSQRPNLFGRSQFFPHTTSRTQLASPVMSKIRAMMKNW